MAFAPPSDIKILFNKIKREVDTSIESYESICNLIKYLEENWIGYVSASSSISKNIILYKSLIRPRRRSSKLNLKFIAKVIVEFLIDAQNEKKHSEKRAQTKVYLPFPGINPWIDNELKFNTKNSFMSFCVLFNIK
ncbi:hypothetical protein BpHYR1_030162 [Brachionus plicatilis]|uniref:Uncharacterized protein n=1 Tax=Brachionus plicatilis TaxID=10195 RepID=A0A3M7R8L4_BRAPC|nr:hypothetical protein BpHYR1_030162 [Brachionus plicatilis]